MRVPVKVLTMLVYEFLMYNTDSLQHRVAAAEIHLLLCPDAKSEAIKIIEESPERYVQLACTAIVLGVKQITGARLSGTPFLTYLIEPCFGAFKTRVASASNDAASEWFLKNCVEVHQLLENSFGDKAAATSKPIEIVVATLRSLLYEQYCTLNSRSSCRDIVYFTNF